MSSVLWLAVLCAVFAVCRWSGRLLDDHYADRMEMSAVLLVGVCVVGSFLLGADSATVWGLPVRWLLGAAMTVGLVVGRRARPA